MATVLLPWNLGSYAPLGGFAGPLRDWLDVQAHVALVRPKAPHELDAAAVEALAGFEPARAGLGALKGPGVFDRRELALLARLPANVEFHHTAPFTTGERPFVLHCETVARMFAPFLAAGQTVEGARSTLKGLLGSDQCLAIYAHLDSTLSELRTVFGGAAVGRKLRRLPLRLIPAPESERAEAQAPTLLFVGPQETGAEALIGAGAVLAIGVLDLVRRTAPEARLIVAARGAREALYGAAAVGPARRVLRSAPVRQRLVRNLDAIVWVEETLTEPSLDRLFRTADVLVAPGLEPATALLMRGLRQGCIPVTLNAPGAAELVKPGRTGLVAEVLNDRLLPRSRLGFVQPDVARFVDLQAEMLAAIELALRPWLPVLVGRSAREAFRAGLRAGVERQFMQDGQFHELDDLLRTCGAQGALIGDLEGWTTPVAPGDYAPRADGRVLELGELSVSRVGAGFATTAAGQAHPRWFPTADAAVLDAISQGPEPFNIDLLPRLQTADFVRSQEMWELTLFAPGVLPLSPPDAPFRAVSAGVAAHGMAPHGEAGDYTLAARVGDRIGAPVRGRMGRWSGATTLEVPPPGPGEAIQLLISPERPGLVQLAGIAVTGPEGEIVAADYRDLPGVGRRDVRLIPADGPAGHVIFGPYLPLEQGAYLLQWRAFAGGEGPAAEVLLTLELLLDEEVVQWRDVTRKDLAGVLEENLDVAPARNGQELQFRLSHHGLADVGLTMARVFKMMSA